MVYSEHTCEKALENQNEGIVINDKQLNNIKHANDSVVIASSLKELQLLMNRVTEVSTEYGLNFNFYKRTSKVICKNLIPDGHRIIN